MILSPDEGLVSLLQAMVDQWGDDLVVGLFESDYEPTANDTIATYNAIEADFPGYARQPLENWMNATLIDSGHARTEADIVTFTRTSDAGGPKTVYGYFVVDQAGNVLWAENGPFAPVVVTDAGDQVTLLPRFSLRPII